MPWAAVANAVGSLADSFFDAQSAKQNIKLQKQFAQEGIQWKVADAKKAGIHPLYALGAQTHSFAPVQTGGGNFSQMGQSVGRAIDAYRDRGERLDGFTKASQSLQLDSLKLDNDIKKAQLASLTATLNQAGTPPAVPSTRSRYLIDGQGSSGKALIQDVPMQRVVSSPEALHQEPGAIPEVGFQRTRTGGYAVTPSKDAKERMEDDVFSEVAWAIRNRLGPMLGGSNMDPPFKAPRGKRWVWSTLNQEYQLVNGERKPRRPSWFWN